ncbi:hypothetical protein BDW02DRAFT_644771 [Decorospora gaudefroyi]|uniref:Uncharacterized protein n=1 Tax=Decorospora gaudefroyi TaxID=184978 RepID=A0A6A5KRQ5_9PLEO|nr:hypothetical protein BDW02DRAFT_644771 [Decorospora gaudefroyi]
MRWDVPGVGTAQPNEDEMASKIRELMRKMQQHNFDGIGMLFARLVSDDSFTARNGKASSRCPERRKISQRDMQMRLFSRKPIKSTGMRTFGVQGEGLESADPEARSRDWFFNNAPTIALTDVGTCLEIFVLREKYFEGRMLSSKARQIQSDTSAEHHPTEDGSVVWNEATAPYQTIATIELPPQVAPTAQRMVFWEDRMKLSHWDALVEHLPLGRINRLG